LSSSPEAFFSVNFEALQKGRQADNLSQQNKKTGLNKDTGKSKEELV